jgi:hypothetical protein
MNQFQRENGLYSKRKWVRFKEKTSQAQIQNSSNLKRKCIRPKEKMSQTKEKILMQKNGFLKTVSL